VREQPDQQAPPVQRLRVRYAKRGRLRFTSHRDFSRAFERALVRAAIPMAYSSGFNPHPRISYAGAAPTGSASEAEYLEIGLARLTDPAEVRGRLDAALPPGLDVLEVVESAGGPLADRLEGSRWRLTLADVSPTAAEGAVRQFLAAADVPVERMTKRGLRTFDCRSAVVSLQVLQDEPHAGPTDSPAPGLRAGSGTEPADDATAEVPHDHGGAQPCAILEVVLRHGTPSVRPDDVLAGLREVSGLRAGPARLFERLAQGPLHEQTGTVGDPLAPDRDAVRPGW
jgi:radical SAM-linked protein